ncbi:MAG: phosphoribosylformylglycinamidine synthase subunit PurQ [Candidatus Altiarchaeota archaeon]|nr:phosphoribosylformylglycinamidine synthase subunit PurQ [Candidatus Altiarchaeota archaeon]
MKNQACVLRIEGTNCEEEARQALSDVGIKAEIVNLKQLTHECSEERHRNLSEYSMLFLPGGWSAGDYIRAGAIFAARLKSRMGEELQDYVESGRMVLGVCNGFQILIELGLLPGWDGMSKQPEAVLAINQNTRFQCRPAYLKHTGKCSLTGKIPKGRVLQIPVAHAEGRLTFGTKNEEMLKRLEKNGQIVFRYCRDDGSEARGEFPWNPNGSLSDIAGICNPEKNVLGMMPHPERVMNACQQADWTRREYGTGDGRALFESVANNLKKLRISR